MPAYLVIEALEVRDPEKYAKYGRLVKPLIESYGGRYLARTDNPELLSSGKTPLCMAIIEVPSKDDIHRCFQRKTYKAAAPLRTEPATTRGVVFEGAV